jgi:hypothetical protein
MLTKSILSIKNADVRIIFFILTVVLFVIGAGAPGAVGI